MNLRKAARRGPKPDKEQSGPGGPADDLRRRLFCKRDPGHRRTGGCAQGSVGDTYFASKEASEAEVIDLYSVARPGQAADFLKNPDLAPLARLEAYFDDRIGAFRASHFARGCLLGNFSAEAADHSALIREHLAKQFRDWSALFGPVLRKPRSRGGSAQSISGGAAGWLHLQQLGGGAVAHAGREERRALLEFRRLGLEKFSDS